MISIKMTFPLVVFATALAAGIAGAVGRYGVIEDEAAHHVCATAIGSWTCDVRNLVIVTLMNTPALGLLALMLGLLAVFGKHRAPIVAAVVTGASGLILYNADLAACGLLLGALRAVRVRDSSAGTQ